MSESAVVGVDIEWDPAIQEGSRAKTAGGVVAPSQAPAQQNEPKARADASAVVEYDGTDALTAGASGTRCSNDLYWFPRHV